MVLCTKFVKSIGGARRSGVGLTHILIIVERMLLPPPFLLLLNSWAYVPPFPRPLYTPNLRMQRSLLTSTPIRHAEPCGVPHRAPSVPAGREVRAPRGDPRGYLRRLAVLRGGCCVPVMRASTAKSKQVYFAGRFTQYFFLDLCCLHKMCIVARGPLCLLRA